MAWLSCSVLIGRQRWLQDPLSCPNSRTLSEKREDIRSISFDMLRISERFAAKVMLSGLKTGS